MRQVPCWVSSGRTLRPFTTFSGDTGQLTPSRKGWNSRSAFSWQSVSSSIRATLSGRSAWTSAGEASQWSRSTTAPWAFSASGRGACRSSPRSTAAQGRGWSSSGCRPAPTRRARSSPDTAMQAEPPRPRHCS